MTGLSCPRLFEVEALRDGRLAGSERLSFQQHLSRCAACGREWKTLDVLGRALRSSSTEEIDALRTRRERVRLLAAFDRTQVERRAPWLPGLERRWPSVAAVIVALVLGALAIGRFSPDDPLAPARDITIRATNGAHWVRQVRAGRDLVVLERGSLWVQARHAPGEMTLAVQLPDGELEDIGTTFSVVVTDGRTTRVEVEEGRVLLRLRGRAPITINSGESWPGPARAPSSKAPPAAPSEFPEPPPEPAPRSPAPAPAPTPTAAPSDASADFREAMDALHRGRAHDAALQFGRFVERHPADPRAEDAAYLRVLALQRAGETAARREAARDYLSRYKAGFRRAEVEELSR